MFWVALTTCVLLCLASVALIWGRVQARAEMRILLQGFSDKMLAENDKLPDQVRAYALACGATGRVRQVYLTQSAEIELSPGAGWQPLQARQWIDAGAAGFVWQAAQRKWGLVILRVIDAYVQGQGRLTVRLLGAIPVVRARGAQVDSSELMRYLAELPWAPDAILSNPDLDWQVPAPNRFRVGSDGVWVDLILNDAGDVVEMLAKDRPALENGQVILRNWRGVFSGHVNRAGRRIPTQGEVGYIRDGIYQPYYRGTVTGYDLLE